MENTGDPRTQEITKFVELNSINLGQAEIEFLGKELSSSINNRFVKSFSFEKISNLVCLKVNEKIIGHFLLHFIPTEFKIFLKKSLLEKSSFDLVKISSPRDKEITHNFMLLKQCADSSSNLTLFLSKILKKKFFTGVEALQILYHSKGSKFAKGQSVNLFESPKFQSIEVQDFNKIFQIVKKSKNKNFNQMVIQKPYLSILGAFMAREFELARYSVIFIFSRNSFLPFSQKEIGNFYYFCNLLLISTIPFIQNETDTSEQHILGSMNIALRNSFARDGKKNWESNSTHIDFFHHQRVTLLGELLNTLRHELSNPIFGIKLSSDMLAQEIKDLETSSAFKQIGVYAEKCEQILKSFSNLYSPEHSIESFSLRELLLGLFTISKSISRGVEREFTFFVEGTQKDDFNVNGDRVLLGQVLLNLIINSCEAINSESLKGKITICGHLQKGTLKIQVADNGPGINPHHIQSMFSPYFTTKQDGTGLGLAICKSLIERVGGTIIARSDGLNRGTIMDILLTNA